MLRSDNGPQFDSDVMAAFASEYEFAHITSSPRYPQSNGLVERSIKTIKNLLKKADDPFLSLLVYRTSPLQWCGYSPSELLMGRRLCTCTSTRAFCPQQLLSITVPTQRQAVGRGEGINGSRGCVEFSTHCWQR